ncbi:MAG TPA: methyltransferase domain-containing protein [Acidimicrobiales bacterium]|nr:methyltransferase domain-containing protein [Acidimicrobiales bacterium]HWI05028.1 methyltransferase domain-containing protein [Acidimicrobiales bacterium]
MEVEQVESCPLCGGGRLKLWRPAPDHNYPSDDWGFEYSCCRDCGARFLSRRPTAATAVELYDDTYEPYDVGVERRARPVELTTGRVGRLPARWIEVVRSAYRLPRPESRLLDLGCGSATFLQAASEAGWTAIGSDFSPAVVMRVKSAGFEAHLIDEVWSALRDEPVDLARMNHVLEHVYDPVDLLRRVASVLAPGGRIHIAVPNPSGVTSLAFGRHWSGLEPRHVIHFSPTLLGSVLDRAGLVLESVSHQPAVRDVKRSVVYALRSHGTPSSVVARFEGRWADRIYAGAAAIGAQLGRGDRLHAIARR